MQNSTINDLISENIPFIIKTLSEATGRYIYIENDDNFSIGLMAFQEALERYDKAKGEFYPFAKLVIKSRIQNYLKKESKVDSLLSLEYIEESGFEIEDNNENNRETSLLREEIELLKGEINNFGFTLYDLVDEAPKHKDTRKNTINISQRVSKDPLLTTFMFEKKRLPIKQISVKFIVTEKILKRSKKFIISVVIIFFRNFRSLKEWIGE